MAGITRTDTRERDPLLKSKLIQSVFPVAGLAFAVIFLLNVVSLGFNETTAEPALFIFVTLPLAVLSLALIWRPGQAAAAPVSEQERAADAVVAAATTARPEAEAAMAGASRWRRLYENDWTISAGVVSGLVLLVVFIHFVGLLVGGGLFMLLMGPFLGYRNLLFGIPVIVGVMALMWLIFEFLLEVPLPKGQWGI